MLDPASFLVGQVEASPDIHFLYDLTAGRVVYVNAAYERLLQGHRPPVNDALPVLLARRYPEDQQQYWAQWQAGELREAVELRLLMPDGTEQWLCLIPYRHQDEAGHVLLGGTLRDISAEREHRANSDRFNAKKNTVLEILAHDLAGAFALLQQLADVVQEETAAADNARVAEMLRLMQRTSQHSTQLIHDLIDQEFLAAAEIPLRRERVDLRDKVAQCLEPFRWAPGREARQLVAELPPEPVYAEVDSNKLLQVVTNLVGNALKFTPDDRRVTVRVEPGAESVRLQVADEGIGIPAALQPVLFDRFTKARRRGLRGGPTTGLGLSLCKTIVELHRGTLNVVTRARAVPSLLNCQYCRRPERLSKKDLLG